MFSFSAICFQPLCRQCLRQKPRPAPFLTRVGSIQCLAPWTKNFSVGILTRVQAQSQSGCERTGMKKKLQGFLIIFVAPQSVGDGTAKPRVDLLNKQMKNRAPELCVPRARDGG